jgi:hypothetical protein
MNKIYLYYIDHDPGYERLKQAVRTVFSVGVSVFLVYFWVGGAGPMLAGFGAGTLSICHDGRNKNQQMLSMLIAGIALIAAVCLGTVLTHYTKTYYLVFAAASFAAFYFREKCGSRYLSFPIFSLLMMMIAFNVPYEFEIFIYPAMVLIGFLTAFIINFYILPENIGLQFEHNFEIFIYKYSRIISALSEGVKKSLSQEYFKKNIFKVDSLISKVKNERILSKGLPLNINVLKVMKQNITNQYELFNLLSMLNESLYFLAEGKLDRKIGILISDVFCELSSTVDMFSVYYNDKTSPVSFDKLEACLHNFSSDLYNILSETGPAATHLSNFAFGIQRTSKLLQKQLSLLEKEEEEYK